MVPAILGTKLGMTRMILEKGVSVPVTVVQAGPCTVIQVKNQEKDKYNAVQLGFQDVRPFRSTKPLIGHAAKAGTGPKRYIREVRLTEATSLNAGDVVTVQLFTEGAVNYVDVTGISKGRGMAGPMKRFGFGGQPASHGTERKHRSPGGIGSSGQRGRGRCIKKGKRMAGHMGHDRVTVRNQKLIGVDAERNVLLIRGGLPGPNGGMVLVRKSKTMS